MMLFVKNMVCARCTIAIRRELEEMNLELANIELGFVDFPFDLTNDQLIELRNRLTHLGFEILHDKKRRLVERVKTLLIKKMQQRKIEKNFSLSKYLYARIKTDYTTISRTFSEMEQYTIEKYFILLRLEKAKELISFGELPMADIAKKLGYSSVQHLSSQFKNVCGVSPNTFKASHSPKRKAIDKIGQ